MSTPQDPDAQGHGPRERPGWNPPGPDDGSQSPYGRQGAQGDAGPYGYQGTQPSGYAYPSPGGGPGVPDKGPAPQEVLRAYYLILAAGGTYLLSSVVTALTTEFPDMAGASVGAGIGIALAVVASAIYVVLAVFIRRGHNWARITATVFAALNVLGMLSNILLLPLVARAAEAGGQALPETSTLALSLGVITMVLGVAGVVMTYLKPARPYFAPQQLGY